MPRIPLLLKYILVLCCLPIALSGCGLRELYQEKPDEGKNAASAGKNAGSSARPTATLKPTATNTPVPTSTLGVEVADLQGVSIVFWHAWTGAPGDVIQSLVDEFNRDNQWGISVEAVAQGSYDQVSEQVSAALENDQPPDVTTAYGYQALGWISPGLSLIDLAPYVDDPVWGLDEQAQSDYYPIFWEHDLQNRERTGIPAQGSAQLLYYNNTWAKELGFENPPATPEEFKAQACAANQTYKQDSDPKNDQKGGWIISTEYSAVLGWIYAFGGEIERADGNGYRFNNAPVKDAFTYMRELYEGSCSWLSESQFPEADFATRQGLFAAGSVAGILYQEEAFVEASSKDEWSVIAFPSLNGEPVISAYGPSFQVLQSTPEEQLASWLFIRWLTEAGPQAKLAEVSGYYPVRASSVEMMGILPSVHPQWKSAVDLLPYARPEPALGSWRIVRWALSDAATQLFRFYFESDQLPALIKLLEETSNDLHAGLK